MCVHPYASCYLQLRWNYHITLQNSKKGTRSLNLADGGWKGEARNGVTPWRQKIEVWTQGRRATKFQRTSICITGCVSAKCHHYIYLTILAQECVEHGNFAGTFSLIAFRKAQKNCTAMVWEQYAEVWNGQEKIIHVIVVIMQMKLNNAKNMSRCIILFC